MVVNHGFMFAEAEKEMQALEGMGENLEKRDNALSEHDFPDTAKGWGEYFDRWTEHIDLNLRIWDRDFAIYEIYNTDWKREWSAIVQEEMKEVSTMAWRDSIDRAASEIGQRMAQEANAARETLAQTFDLRLRTAEMIYPRDFSQDGVVKHDATQPPAPKAPDIEPER